jgi:LacI family transcriptional regulator
VATIKDVARLAGVGLGTASRVVSGKGSVSPARLERVQKAIEELGFRPSHTARALMSGSTKMIGVYIPILKGSFYTPILAAIDQVLREVGLNMVVAFGAGIGDARRQTLDGIDLLMERGCDGLIVMSNSLSDRDIPLLHRWRSRIVVMNHHLDSIAPQCFTIDHRQGGMLAARALLEQRHRKIAVIAGPATAPDNVERVNGFLSELAAKGVDTSRIWIAERDFSPQGGWSATEELLASGYQFTALFCANDEMAIGALSCFQKAGIAAPHEVSVIGYDDIPSAEFSAPRLTTVHIPWRDLVVNGVNALLNLCYDMHRPVAHDLPLSVTYRDSLAPAPAGRRKSA